MNTVNYNSKVNGIVFTVAVGSSASNATFCTADDHNIFYDTESYKQNTNFLSSQTIQQIAVLTVKPNTTITSQTFTLGISGYTAQQGMNSSLDSESVQFPTSGSFSNISPANGDTLSLSTDHDSNPTVANNGGSNVTSFIVKQLDLPSDVNCNYTTTGTFYSKTGVIISLTGNIKTGDTVEIKRTKNTASPDMVLTFTRDTTSVAKAFGIHQDEELSIIYHHKDVTPVTRTVNYTSDDSNIKWLKATTDNGTNETNTIQFAKGSYVDSNPALFNIVLTHQDNTTETHSFKLATTNTLYQTYTDTLLTLPDLTNVTTVNIPQQSKLFQSELTLNIQNCDVIVPQQTADDWGSSHYYLDRDNRTVTLKTHAGFVFTSDGTLVYKIYGSSDDQTLILKANNSDTLSVDLPDDFDPSQPTTLTIGAATPEIVDTTGGFVNFYKADYQSLINFSNDWITYIGDHGTLNIYDIASYISNLILIPFDVPAKLIKAKSAIIAGNKSYNTEMPTISDSHYIYDLGSITTPETYKNGYDYFQVKTRLVLPFTDTVDLDPKHVINKTISIKYDVKFQNGDTTVIIANDDGVFFTKSVNLANEIPFVTASTNASQYIAINKLQERFNNGVYQAYVLIEQPTPVLNSDYYPTNEKGTLQGYNGNVKASLLNNVNINPDDLNALQNILETGVKIK